MTQNTAHAEHTAAATDGTARDATATRTTRALLACGTVAGPLFLVVAFVQVFTRDGFDLTRHPLSLLSLGDLGWIQITNFVVAGLLYLAGAVGMRRVLHPGRGGTWGPRLVAVFGLALVWGGVFVADPADGFPPGTPDGTATLSWHGVLHSLGPPMGFLALAAACFVFARRFAVVKRHGWAAYSAATGVALFVPDLFLNHDWFAVVLALSAVAGWSWLSLTAARLMTELTHRAR